MSQSHFNERGREYKPFPPLLNWQCVSSTADTGGEQSVPRHMSGTAKESGESAVDMTHSSFCPCASANKIKKCSLEMPHSLCSVWLYKKRGAEKPLWALIHKKNHLNGFIIEIIKSYMSNEMSNERGRIFQKFNLKMCSGKKKGYQILYKFFKNLSRQQDLYYNNEHYIY